MSEGSRGRMKGGNEVERGIWMGFGWGEKVNEV